MSVLGCLKSRLNLGLTLLPKIGSSTRKTNVNIFRMYSSIDSALIEPKKSTVSADVDIVNYSLAGCYLVGYNEYGFQLSNGAVVYGPMVSFPQNAFSWNIRSAKDINEDSISLFRVLCPSLEVLVIGKGTANEEINQRKIMNMCWKHNIGVEILPTPTAIGVFNFLNAEGRYVAAGLIPPIRLDVFDSAKSEVKKLEASRHVQLNIEPQPKLKKLPGVEPPEILKPLLDDKKK